MFEREHRKRPDAAADALHAERLALEIGRLGDIRGNHKVAVQLVDDPGDENQIEASGHRSESRSGCRRGVELSFIGGHRRHGHGSVAHLDDLRVQALLFEEAHLLGDEDKAGSLVETGEDEDNFLRRRRCLDSKNLQRSNNERDDGPSDNRIFAHGSLSSK